jgi:CHRD domain-containing protein
MKKNNVLYIVLILLTALALASIAADGGRKFTTTLTGAAEVPGPGDPDGSGTATVTLNPGQGEVCWDITFSGVDTITAAHIHVGEVGVAGPVVVPLSPTSGCTSADRDLIKAIIQNPEGYYVNIHNAPFPAGALRGQLGK